jgi:hypothetical protein
MTRHLHHRRDWYHAKDAIADDNYVRQKQDQATYGKRGIFTLPCSAVGAARRNDGRSSANIPERENDCTEGCVIGEAPPVFSCCANSTTRIKSAVDSIRSHPDRIATQKGEMPDKNNLANLR